jgi:DNA-binding NtrC family response regulator
MMAKTLCDIIKIKGYEADISSSGKEALEKLERNEYHCVLSDIKMPGMNGLELYKNIKKKFADLPVVLMTAYISPGLAEEALKEGVISVLTKPLDIKLILDFISRLKEEKIITIIDDEPEFCNVITDLLIERSYKVIQINDMDNIDKMVKDDADAILLDMKLDGTDGLEVLEKIRKKYPSLPVIIVTGYRELMAHKIEKALEIGAYTCFYKPFHMKELLGALGDIRNKELGKVFGNNR